MTYPETHKQTPNVSNRENEKLGVVMHHTGGGYGGAVAWLTNSQSGVSAHVVIAKDGRRTTLAEDDEVTWHAGYGKWKGTNPNYVSLGVEFELTSQDVRDGVLLTDDQIASMIEWLRPRWKKYGWTLNDVTHHAAIDQRKIDLSLGNWGRVYQAIKRMSREGQEPEPSLYLVQIGAFSTKERAEAQADSAKAAGFDAIIKKQP